MSRIEKLKDCFRSCDGVYITGKANIFYYSGFTSDDAALLITKENAYIITDFRYILQAKKEAPDFELYNISNGLEALLSKLNLDTLGYEENALSAGGLKKLERAAEGVTLLPMSYEISLPRQVKEPSEIEKIRLAEELGDAAFSHILGFIKEEMTEKEIALELEFYMKKNGASALSFDTIVASGCRSAMPHGTASEKPVKNGEFLTMDFGCVLDGYCSDMTRTIILGYADQRQREIYSIVLDSQRAALDVITSGIPCKSVDEAARKIIDDAGYSENFGHSLGHSVGIEIHEAPNFSPKSDDIAVYGNVITVEPGIYIEDFGGVRIEDIVAITPKNAQNLTKSEKELIIL